MTADPQGMSRIIPDSPQPMTGTCSRDADAELLLLALPSSITLGHDGGSHGKPDHVHSVTSLRATGTVFICKLFGSKEVGWADTQCSGHVRGPQHLQGDGEQQPGEVDEHGCGAVGRGVRHVTSATLVGLEAGGEPEEGLVPAGRTCFEQILPGLEEAREEDAAVGVGVAFLSLIVGHKHGR